MDAPLSRPNILFLRGITMAGFTPIEDVFDEKVLEAAEKEERPPDPLPHDRIPPVFTRLEDWLLATNLRCWNCTFTFDGAPWFAPTFVRQVDADGEDAVEFGVEGNFCTPNCAARYINDTYPPQAFAAKHWRMSDNLCLVYFCFTGHRTKHIKPAPARTELLEYGGGLDADEFWARLRELDPKHGLRDHRPGTVLPERMRPRLEEAASVWGVCGVEKPRRPKAPANNVEDVALTSDQMAAELEVAPASAMAAALEDAEAAPASVTPADDAPAGATSSTAPAAKGEAAEGEAAEGLDFDQMLEDLYDL